MVKKLATKLRSLTVDFFQEQIQWSATNIENSNFSASKGEWALS